MDEQEFRAGLRAYFDGMDIPAAVHAEEDADPGTIGPNGKEFVRRLGRDGWLGLSVPVEHGGRGLTAVEQLIFHEEVKYRCLPYNGLTTTAVAPTLVRAGTEDQRERYMPGILSGDSTFAIGYSEPEAGTDLAGLQLRAERRGDTYVLNGQKIWTTGAHVATHLWVAARTGERDSRHRGISLFIVPAGVPGLTVRGIETVSGERTNEVFFTDVEVPMRDRIGAENDGWSVIMLQLNFERLFPHTDNRHDLEDLVGVLLDERGADDVVADPAVAELALDVEIDRLLSWRNARVIDSGGAPHAGASMSKVWHTETKQRIAIGALDLLGAGAQVGFGEPGAPAASIFERAYRRSTILKFAGGANEVMRDIVANRGLGLPR